MDRREWVMEQNKAKDAKTERDAEAAKQKEEDRVIHVATDGSTYEPPTHVPAHPSSPPIAATVRSNGDSTSIGSGENKLTPIALRTPMDRRTSATARTDVESAAPAPIPLPMHTDIPVTVPPPVPVPVIDSKTVENSSSTAGVVVATTSGSVSAVVGHSAPAGAVSVTDANPNAPAPTAATALTDAMDLKRTESIVPPPPAPDADPEPMRAPGPSTDSQKAPLLSS